MKPLALGRRERRVPAARITLIRHNHDVNPAYFSHDFAIRRAHHKALVTGIRHRVEICRHTPQEHYLDVVWSDPHYVVRPVDEPASDVTAVTP